LQDMIAALQPNTRIGIATDLTLPTQLIQCHTAKAWRAMPALPSLHRRPTVFSLMA
jgi:16S rRNA (cytidine1402-2'-O)-methyltransferase